MVKREELEAWLNDYLEVYSISDSLPNGLQIEGKDTIEKLVTAVSINLEIIEAAVLKDAEALLVHHGMFWKNEDVTIKGYRKVRIKKILEHDINLFAFHLPLDMHPELSHNRLILKSLGAEIVEKVGNTEQDKSIGLQGTFKTPLSFDALVKRINSELQTEAKYFKYGKDYIESLFVVSGAGRNEVDKITRLEVDAYLTGDVQENTEYIAREDKLNYIFAGHYNTERVGIIELGKKIAERFHIDVEFLDIHNPL